MTRTIITTLIMAISFLAVPAYAQQGEGDKRETRKAVAMSEKVYNKLTEAQELIEAKDYNGGLALLTELEQDAKLSPYEKAQTYNYFAYTYFTLERYPEAIRAYQSVLRQPELPEGLIQSSLYTIAQLYFIQEDYQKAVDAINDWFKIAPKPTENAYMLLGQGYYQMEKYNESLKPLIEAYDMVTARGDTPKETLLLLLRVDYFNLGDYPSMVRILKELVDLYPKVEYWKTMAGAYSELEQLDKQMSIFEMLYERGHLQRGNEQLNLANLYLMHEVPYKAAVLLDSGMKKGVIEKSVKNLRLLSQAWLQAQESKNSIEPLTEAARLSREGDLDVRLAQAHINLDNYKDAVESLRTGIKKKGVKRLDQAYVMLGMALFELKQFNGSIEAFRQAAKDRRSQKTAESWLKYVQTERDREKQLEEALNRRRG